MLKDLPFFRKICLLITGFILLGLLSAVIAAAAAALADHDSKPVVAEPLQVVSQTENTTLPPQGEGQPYYAEKVVYLTFDDGPDPTVTPVVLQTLKQYGVPATFFVVGSQVENSPELLRQIHAAGHAIGNHSYNHRYKELYSSTAAYTAQFKQCDALISAILGIKPVISRAPGGTAGSFTSEFWAGLQQKDVGWNISSGDASSAKAVQIAGNVIAQAQKNKFLWSHAIVLMHDGKGHAETAAALPAIIEFFQKEGFEFRTVDRSTPPAW